MGVQNTELTFSDYTKCTSGDERLDGERHEEDQEEEEEASKSHGKKAKSGNQRDVMARLTL